MDLDSGVDAATGADAGADTGADAGADTGADAGVGVLDAGADGGTLVANCVQLGTTEISGASYVGRLAREPTITTDSSRFFVSWVESPWGDGGTLVGTKTIVETAVTPSQCWFAAEAADNEEFMSPSLAVYADELALVFGGRTQLGAAFYLTRYNTDAGDCLSLVQPKSRFVETASPDASALPSRVLSGNGFFHDVFSFAGVPSGAAGPGCALCVNGWVYQGVPAAPFGVRSQSGVPVAFDADRSTRNFAAWNGAFVGLLFQTGTALCFEMVDPLTGGSMIASGPLRISESGSAPQGIAWNARTGEFGVLHSNLSPGRGLNLSTVRSQGNGDGGFEVSAASTFWTSTPVVSGAIVASPDAGAWAVAASGFENFAGGSREEVRLFVVDRGAASVSGPLVSLNVLPPIDGGDPPPQLGFVGVAATASRRFGVVWSQQSPIGAPAPGSWVFFANVACN